MDYKPLYLTLFNCLTDALRCLDHGDPDGAKAILIRAQQQAEQYYIEADPEPAP